jgi:predicted Zn-dependent peptidase
MTPGGSILAVAGAVEHAAVVDRAAALTEGWAGRALDIRVGDDPARGYLHEPDQTDQTHIAVAMDAPVEGSDESWLERVATAVLSGGMSGRLFTELRERRSLCYSVHAAYGAEADYGRRVAYVGTTPERAQESLDTLLGELRRIGTGPGAVTAEEHRRAVVGLKSRLVFSGESSGARASALAHDVRKLGHARSLEEMAERISGVTLAALNDYLSSRTLGRITVASIGPAALSAPAGV